MYKALIWRTLHLLWRKVLTWFTVLPYVFLLGVPYAYYQYSVLYTYLLCSTLNCCTELHLFIVKKTSLLYRTLTCYTIHFPVEQYTELF